MNGNRKKLMTIVEGLNKAQLDAGVEVVVAPPSLYLLTLHEQLRKEIALAGQNTCVVCPDVRLPAT